jgi:perosamine synthetase
MRWRDLWYGLAATVNPENATREVERQIRQEFGVRHVFLTSSGKAALTLTFKALRALAPAARTRVVLPAYTCFSVPAAVLNAGLQPVLCDIDPATFDFDHRELGAKVNDQTLCVVAQHLFGVPAAIEKIRAVCQRHRVLLVEDAAQAMGGECCGRRLGTLGDVGIFSLGRGKSITCGSGGVVVTNSDAMAIAIAAHYYALPCSTPFEQLKDFVACLLMAVFIRPSLYWIPASLPFLGLGRTVFPRTIQVRRLSGVKAGLLRGWQRHLAESNRARATSTAFFDARVRTRERSQRPSAPLLRLPIVVSSREERERLYALSQKRGLGLSVAYPSPINEIPEIASTFGGQRFPGARQVADRLLTLPTHHWLSMNDKRAIADLVCDRPAA